MKIRIGEIAVVAASVIFVLNGCSHSKQSVVHKGERKLTYSVADMDSVVIEDDYLSGRYNVFMIDSCVVYTDLIQHTLNFYSLEEGALCRRALGYGNGPNELTSMLYAQPVKNADGEILIIDSSDGMFIYNPRIDNLEYRGVIDFNWGNGTNDDYDDTANYNLMEMSDFAISFIRQDSSILLPLSIIDRNFKDIDARRYSAGHILGRLDEPSMKVSDIFGSFPVLYESKPMPFFEFFDFDVDDTTGNIIYNFAPDSLIYVADSNGNPLWSMGFEPEGIDRSYSVGFDSDVEKFKKDTQRVGVNTGLYYDGETGMLFRTSIQNFATGNVVMQGYDADGNLLLEERMPPYFKMLGKHDGYYYGARFMPVEDDENIRYPVYRFKIS